MSAYDYPPGSDEAKDRGCRCPVLDNGHGAGRFGDGDHYTVVLDCPLHGGGSEGDV